MRTITPASERLNPHEYSLSIAPICSLCADIATYMLRMRTAADSGDAADDRISESAKIRYPRGVVEVGGGSVRQHK